MVHPDAKSKASEIAIQPKRADGSSPQTIGVMLGPNFVKVEKIQNSNLVEASKLAWRYLSDALSQTLDGLLMFFGQILMGKDPPAGQSVSGPIGLIKAGADVVSTKDWTTAFMFAAALSVNLGVINALPLPALDGGQLAFVLAEALTRRKIDQRFQEGITSVAVLFLLWISVYTTFGDVVSIISQR